MKFVLSRTSSFTSEIRMTWYDGTPFAEGGLENPTEDVIKDVPEKFNPKIETLTEKDGSKFNVWTIELETLNDLMELATSVGCKVITEIEHNVYDFGVPSIEIYDDWRE